MVAPAPVSKQAVAHKEIEASPAQSMPVLKAGGAGGCERFRSLVQGYDWDADMMLAIMRAESSCDPDATGDKSLTFQRNGRIYGYSVSLFQVRILPGREHCDSHDPGINISCAYHIWKSQGYAAWSVYINGKYRSFL